MCIRDSHRRIQFICQVGIAETMVVQQDEAFEQQVYHAACWLGRRDLPNLSSYSDQNRLESFELFQIRALYRLYL